MLEKNNNKKDNFWRKLWKLLAPSHKKLKILVSAILFIELFGMLGPYILKLIIDRIVEFRPEDIGFIVLLIFSMLAVNQLHSLFIFFKEKRMLSFLIDLEKYLIVAAQKKLVHLSLHYHEKENTGNKISKIERGVDKISDMMANMLYDVLPSTFQLVITIGVLSFIDYRFALSLAFFAPIFIWITFKSNFNLRPVRKKRYENYEKSSGMMGQSIININTVKSFVQENREVSLYEKLRKKIAKDEIKEWYSLINFGLARNFVIDLGRATILFLGVYFVINDMVSIGSLVFVITLSEKAYFSLFRLSRVYDRVEEGREAVNRLIKLENEESDIKNPANGIKPKTLRGDIRFNNLSFSYSGDKEKALNKIDLKINEACVTALVGPSGGGKTTITRMIYRHYDPQEGSVLIDGVDLRDYDLYALRKNIAIVPQEVEIFNDSIENNIAYGRPGASKNEIHAAAKIANADEFIRDMPLAYKTEVGERGVKLSGGQRQRIGIARAILAEPKILIFDEATSNLDSKSEKLIQEAMDKIGRGKTMIIIAHRLSTIKNADKIVVLEKGQVVEQGSHYELSVKKGGLYKNLIKLQQLGEID